MKASAWIDKVKAARGWESDYRVAKELNLGRQTVSTYRSRPSATMDEDAALKVAHALEIDPVIILADQAMERAKNDEARSAWAEILQRLGGVAAGLFVAVGMGATPSPSSAAPVVNDPGMYIMSSNKRRKKSQKDRPLSNCWPFSPLFPTSKRALI